MGDMSSLPPEQPMFGHFSVRTLRSMASQLIYVWVQAREEDGLQKWLWRFHSDVRYLMCSGDFCVVCIFAD